MPRDPLDEPPESDDICGEELGTQPGKYCPNDVSKPDGVCGVHSKFRKPRDSKEDPKNLRHGAYANPSRYFVHLPDKEKTLVKSMFWSFIEDAPFGEENHGKCQILWDTCIEIHKKKNINDYIGEEGMATERFQGAGDSGAFYEDEENPLNLTYDRLSRSSIRSLKELGILSDPDSQKAEATQSFVDLFTED